MKNTIDYKGKYEVEQSNKALVLKAYQALFGDLDVSVLGKYWTENFRQHNPMAEDGTQGLRKIVERMIAAGAPKSKLDIKRISAENDLVWVHLKMSFMGKDQAIVDIFRVENGKLAEHWDVLQEVPEKSSNNNTMF